MSIKFKKLSEKAVQPVRTTASGAGYELTATEIKTEINERGQIVICYHTGIGVEIPAGYEGYIRPTETIYAKTLRMCNAPCVISGNIDDEIVVRFMATTDVVPAVFKAEEPVAQLVINKVEDIDFVEFIDTTTDASAPEAPQSSPETEDASISSESATQGSGGEENIPEQA